MQQVLYKYRNKNLIVGTHGTFLAVYLNNYNSKYDFKFWKNMKMPDIFKCEYDGDRLVAIENFKI